MLLCLCQCPSLENVHVLMAGHHICCEVNIFFNLSYIADGNDISIRLKMPTIMYMNTQ